jgi:gliding motility-associated-like protein
LDRITHKLQKLLLTKRLTFVLIFVAFTNVLIAGFTNHYSCKSYTYSSNQIVDVANEGENFAAINYSISSVTCVPPSNSVAGPNQTLCISNPSTNLAANIPTLGSGNWSLIAGSGVLSNSLSPTTAVSSLGVGNNVFAWTISNGTCTSVSSVTIYVEDLARAGANQSTCILSPTATLAANNLPNGVVTWSVLTGTGILANPNLFNTTITNLSVGTNILEWSIISSGICPSSSATMAIEVDIVNNVAIAGPSQTLCANSPVTILAANTPTSGFGAWAFTSGGGTITSPLTATTSVTNLNVGINVLTWNIVSFGACPNSVSALTIQVDPSTSNAISGPNQVICASSPSVVLSANSPTSGVGTWSLISGSGSISNASSFSTAVTGLGVGANVLRWGIASAGICPNSSSTLIVQVHPEVSISNAGSDQTVCINSSFATLSANTPTTGIGNWSVIGGSGTVANPFQGNTILTSLGAGITILEWEIAATGVCPSSTSTISIQVDDETSVALAGSNQTVCISSPTANLFANSPIIGLGNWSLLSGSGVFTNSLSAITTVTNLSIGTNVLRWNIASVNSCLSTSSTLTVMVNALSGAATTSGNQTLCISTPTTLLNGNIATPGIGTWSLISGTASIASINNPTSAVTGLGAGANILLWSVTNGVCPSNTAITTVQVDNLPSTALAGSNQSICASSPSTTLASIASSGVGTWSLIAGSGIITSINNPSTTVTSLGSGTNVLRWTISNFCGANSSTMSVVVDQVPTTAVAGTNQSQCSLTPPSFSAAPVLTLSANTPVVGVGSWSVISGSGVISSSNSPVTTFSNIGVGSNILRWRISNGACPPSTSTIVIIIDDYSNGPSAGPNQTICASNPTATLAAIQPTSGTSNWNVLLGTGVVTTPTLATSVVTNLQLGTNLLEWAAYNGNCPTFLSFVNINVTPAPTTASITTPNQSICAVSTITIAISANVPTVGVGSWSFAQGSGTIANTNSATTTATLNQGSNVLVWSINNGGVCGSSTASLSIAVTGTPSIANAGPNQTICINSPTTTLAAITPTGGVGSWSVISGGGSVTTPSLTNSTVTGLPVGTNVLRWTVNSACPGTNSSTMSIKVDNLPSTPFAGSNQTICSTVPNTTLTGSSPTLGVGSWSLISGSGSIVNSSLTTTGVNGLGLGTSIFQWKITNGACISTSTVSVLVNSPPTAANAAVNQSICVTTASATLAGNVPAIGTGSWSILSGSGVVTTPTLNNTTVTGLTTSGTRTLQWSISNPGCPSSNDIVLIRVYALPSTAIAGAAQSICASTSSAALSANVPTLGVGSWSVIGGSGVLSNSNSATSNVSGLSIGINVLEWRIRNVACVSTSTTTVNVSANATPAFAGSSQSICINSPSTTLTGNTPTVGVGTWSILSGSGTITALTSPTTGLTGLTVGNTVLRWTITNGACVSPISTLTIAVFGLPGTSVAGPNQTLCVSSPSTVLSANIPTTGIGSWSIISGSGTFSNPNSQTSNVTSLGLGLNVLQWQLTNGACTNTSTKSIQVDDVPDISNAGSTQSICISSPNTNLNGNIPLVGDGVWTVLSGTATIVTPTLANTAALNFGLGINVLRWSISNGVCAVSNSTVSIIVDNVVPLSVAGSNQTLCVNSPSATLAANTPTSGLGAWSVISGSGVISDPTLAVTTITALGVGTTILDWTITKGGCSSTSSLSIDVDDYADISIAGSNQTICVTELLVQLSANTPTVGNGFWSNLSGSGLILGPSDPESVVGLLGIGTNIFQWTTSSGVCPPNSSTVAIIVDDLAETSLAGTDQTICISSPSVSLNANTPSAGVGSWAIFSGIGTISNATLANTTVTNLGSGINILEWTISNGACTNASTVSLQVDDLPSNASAGTNQSLCISSPSTVLNANVPSVGVGSWSVLTGSGVITDTTVPNSTVSGLNLGATILQWSVSNGVCATSISTVVLQVDNLAVPAVAGSNQTLCATSPSTSLAANTPSAGIGAWSIISGTGVISSLTLATTSVTALGVGSNILQWAISNGGCVSTSTIDIQVDNLSSLSNAGPNQLVCINSPIATLAAVTPTFGIGTWSLIAGSGTINNPTSPNTSVSGLGLGTTVLQWSVVNGTCPPSISTMNIQVDALPTTANAGSNQTLCNTTTTLGANTPAIGIGSWSVISGSATVNTASLSTSLLTGIGAGLSILQWNITNGGCISTATVGIQMNGATASVSAGNGGTICPSTFTMSASVASVGVGFWSLVSGSGNIVNPLNPQTEITNLGAGANLFKWTVTNGVCFVNADSLVILRNPPTDAADAGQDVEIDLNRYSLQANQPVNGQGTWEIVSGYCTFSNPTSYNSIASDLSPGENILKWKITGLCGFTEDDIKIVLLAATLPNAISPNGDGKNDFFEVPNITNYNKIELVVYNRWGSLVFEDKNYANKWNGINIQGSPLTEDTYFYTLKLDEVARRGFIIIKR